MTAACFQDMAAVCTILFGTAEALATIAARRSEKYLGARSATMVLHIWGQTLQHHSHVHCVVPDGGPSLHGTCWVAYRPGFFLPVRVSSQLFRRLAVQAVPRSSEFRS